MDVSGKNYVEKRLLRMFLTEDKVLMACLGGAVGSIAVRAAWLR